MGCQRKCKCKKQLLYVDAQNDAGFAQFKANLSEEVMDQFEVRRFVEADWLAGVRGGIVERTPGRRMLATTDSSARRLMDLAKFAGYFRYIWSMCPIAGAFITENMKQLNYDEQGDPFWAAEYRGKVKDAVAVARPLVDIDSAANVKYVCVNGGSTVVTNVLKNDGAQMRIVMNRAPTEEEFPALKLASDGGKLLVTYQGLAKIQPIAEANNWTTKINRDGKYVIEHQEYGKLAFDPMVDPGLATQAAGLFVAPETRFCLHEPAKVTALAFNRTYPHVHF